MNYRAHILEMSREFPSYPTLFAKFASGLIGAHDDLVLPSVTDAVDWEVELASSSVVASAREPRAGSRRNCRVHDRQRRVHARLASQTTQYLQGKAFDASTRSVLSGDRDEIGDAADLEVRCEVDGVVMQHGRTSDLLFGPAAVVSYISQFATLCPGDLISTEPQEALEPGATRKCSSRRSSADYRNRGDRQLREPLRC